MKPANIRFSRRSILKLATSSTLLTVLSGFSSGCSPEKADLRSVAKTMTEVLYYPKQAKKIGSRYIAQTPELQQRSYEAITKKILVILELDHEHITKKQLNSLVTRLRKKVRQDFEHENVVVVDGFMLSKTEALLCTLAATYRS